MIENIQNWIAENPLWGNVLTALGIFLLIVISYLIAYRLVARGLFYIAGQTESKYDDIILRRIRPRRLSLIVPLLVIYYFAYLTPETEDLIQQIVIFLILWLSVLTFNGLLDATNDIYESRRTFSGASIRGYLDVLKIMAYLTGIILSFSLFTGESPIGLLAGLGAITAILLLIFRDTILSIVASVQISANDLVKEGDWLEVPTYNADGDVLDISLHQIKIQNWDKTISVVPTYKLVDSSYKNWRGMSESGSRRIKRAIHIDIHSIRFCDQAMLERFKRFELVCDYIEDKLKELAQGMTIEDNEDFTPTIAPLLTNVSIFRAYIEAYMKNHPQIRQDMILFVRHLAPEAIGLPIEINAFTKTTVTTEYEDIQAEIFEHLLAIVSEFDLRVFQEPSGSDFESLVHSI
jgi:miniconductance mechanosensitive channel